MMIARWSITAKFGYKQDLLKLMNRWLDEIGPQVGYTRDNQRILTGSVGVAESVIQTETTVKDLAELNATWEKLASIPAHQQWGKEIEPYVVSGSNRWEIYRLL
jgi:hypothetical protein